MELKCLYVVFGGGCLFVCFALFCLLGFLGVFLFFAWGFFFFFGGGGVNLVGGGCLRCFVLW